MDDQVQSICQVGTSGKPCVLALFGTVVPAVLQVVVVFNGRRFFEMATTDLPWLGGRHLPRGEFRCMVLYKGAH
jgi:hypothetical protein